MKRYYILIVVVQCFFLQVSPAMLSNGNLTHLLDLLSDKLKLFKFNNSNSEIYTRLSKTEKQIKNLLKTLRVSVPNINKTNSARTLSRHTTDCRNINIGCEVENVNCAIDHYTKEYDKGDLAKKIATKTTACSVCSYSMRKSDDYLNDVLHSVSDTVQLFNQSKGSTPSKFDNYYNLKVQKLYRKKSSDPILMRFRQIIDVLDRPNGVDEAYKSATAWTSNLSITLDHVEFPLNTIVDDNALVESVLQRLKTLHESKSSLRNN